MMISSQHIVLFLSAWLFAVAVGQEPSGAPSISAEPTMSMVPTVSMVPTTSAAPTEMTSLDCQGNSRCAVLGLSGQCCPTMDGWTLDCCDSAPVIEETCELNPTCAELTLVGSCCPTITQGWGYLDCCSTFPAACASGPSENCTISSAEKYLEFLSQTSGARFTSGLMIGTALVFAALML